MRLLAWQETAEGYRSAGYQLTAPEVDGRWRLLSPGSIRAIQSRQPQVATSHRSSEDAMAWAEFLEKEEIERIAFKMHTALAITALVAFTVMADAIGSLLGLALVSVSFYVTLRSGANAVGIFLQDAWGWTRPGASRLGILERWVLSSARRRRRRALTSIPPIVPAVRPLDSTF